jgi:drug/metabolite transporter (DMT)-like permease
VDAVLLAVASAFLFGAMTVALRYSLARAGAAEVGTLATVCVALAVSVPFAAFALAGDPGAAAGVWPFLLAGVLGPGLSQLFFTLAVRDAGPSRASVVVGTAPLFSVVFALALLEEPASAPLLLGAVLVVLGGVLLVAERERPEHVRTIGLLFALACTLVFSVRDNLVRWLSVDTEVPAALATAATLAAGSATLAVFLLGRRRGRVVDGRTLRAFALPGLLFGLSYVCLFEAYYRGRVTVVSPLVATESLWGVGLSALLLRRHELVGVRLAAGALLVVAGGVLIGVFF